MILFGCQALGSQKSQSSSHGPWPRGHFAGLPGAMADPATVSAPLDGGSMAAKGCHCEERERCAFSGVVPPATQGWVHGARLKGSASDMISKVENAKTVRCLNHQKTSKNYRTAMEG